MIMRLNVSYRFSYYVICIKPARMVVGALIVKHMMNLSDGETILMI